MVSNELSPLTLYREATGVSSHGHGSTNRHAFACGRLLPYNPASDGGLYGCKAAGMFLILRQQKMMRRRCSREWFGGSARHFSHSKPLMTVNDSLNRIAASAVFAAVVR